MALLRLSGPSWCNLQRRIRPVAVALALFPVTVRAWDTDPKVVDLTPAITIGSFDLTQYVLDKNYNQFASRQRNGSPTGSEASAWFELFLAHEKIGVDRLRDGYLERPEVRDNVESMARYTMTGEHGLFFATLYDQRPIPPERVERAFAASARVLDATIVRFDNQDSARRAIGDVTGEKLAELLVTLARAGETRGVDVHDGPIVWPFHPFEEMESTLLAGTSGNVVGPLQRKLGVYYVLVRGEKRRSQPKFESVRDGLAAYLRELDESMVRRVRHRDVLQQFQFVAFPEAISNLSEHLCIAKHEYNQITPDAIAGIDAVPLASYWRDGERRTIAVGEFARRFNRQVLPKWPSNRAECLTELEDQFEAEIDWDSARRAGLDRQPKFVQDRLNFALTQARALYESETLAPRVRPSDAEVRDYYERHLERYAAISDAAGVLYFFSSRANAAEAVGRQFAAPSDSLKGDIGEQAVVVRRSAPPVLPGVSNILLIEMPVNKPFGPVQIGDRQAVYMKRSSGPRVPLPLDLIVAAVRRDLLQERLDALELEMFEHDHASVQIYTDLSRYGIAGGRHGPAWLESLSSLPRSRGTRDARSGGEAVNTHNQQPNHST